MPVLVACTFREPGKSYYLDPAGLPLHIGTPVVAETDRGVELGRVKYLPAELDSEKIPRPVKPVLRIATADDIQTDQRNREYEPEAMREVREGVKSLELPMKPIKVELLLDRSRLFFYYESEERVDFRELLRDLSTRLRMRMQFQQVGARDAARVLDGVGPCGKPLCCATFLHHTPSVTLKLAKEQGLALTPNKISGACGRLMCCLRYEVDFYRDQAQLLPRVNSLVDTPQGPGQVVDVNVLTEAITVQVGEEQQRVVFTAQALRDTREQRGPAVPCGSATEGTCQQRQPEAGDEGPAAGILGLETEVQGESRVMGRESRAEGRESRVASRESRAGGPDARTKGQRSGSRKQSPRRDTRAPQAAAPPPAKPLEPEKTSALPETSEPADSKRELSFRARLPHLRSSGRKRRFGSKPEADPGAKSDGGAESDGRAEGDAGAGTGEGA